jgi:aldehyde dehydrogenase family 7 protein A1
MGKIKSEGLGEVQEFIDICDMAVGLSRTISGKVIPSERKDHWMLEQWNPMGIVGVISAFNFPIAVAGWNISLALICGDMVVWKPALTTSLTSIALQKVMAGVLKRNGFNNVITLVCGDGPNIGNALVMDKNVPLISFTGSTAVGRYIASEVAKRFGKTILELGGNNASIVMPDCDLEIAFTGSVFGAVGTCGQRCTSLRRLFLHESVYDQFLNRMVKAYPKVETRLGDPLDDNTLVGPLHYKESVTMYLNAV